LNRFPNSTGVIIPRAEWRLRRYGGLDAAVIARPIHPLPQTISAATLLADQLLAVFDPGAFAIDSGPVALAVLQSYPIISYAPSSGLRPILDTAFAAATAASSP